MSTKPIRDVKVKGIKWIENKYDVDIGLYNEVGVNMKNSLKGSDFQGWMGDHGKSRCVMAYNVKEESAKTIHQPGGTAIRVRGTLTQYVKSTSKDSRGLGRYCSVVLWANPNQKCRMVAACDVCKGKPKGI